MVLLVLRSGSVGNIALAVLTYSGVPGSISRPPISPIPPKGTSTASTYPPSAIREVCTSALYCDCIALAVVGSCVDIGCDIESRVGSVAVALTVLV